jgi:hypothetical protein
MAQAGSADLPDGESGIFLRVGLDRKLLICPTAKAEYFCEWDWTGNC